MWQVLAGRSRNLHRTRRGCLLWHHAVAVAVGVGVVPERPADSNRVDSIHTAHSMRSVVLVCIEASCIQTPSNNRIPMDQMNTVARRETNQQGTKGNQRRPK